MANILTAADAATVLRVDATDPAMLILLPSIDAYIKNASGRDWAADAAIQPLAKAAAQILLVQWYETPDMLAPRIVTMEAGLNSCLAQLEALALELESAGVPDEDLALAAQIPVDRARGVAISIKPVLIFNHAMDSSVTTAVVLQTASGATVASTNTLDVTGKILTITPTASLTAATPYVLTLSAAADVYGQSLTKNIRFTTA